MNTPGMLLGTEFCFKALIQLLAWELPYATGAALKKKREKKYSYVW